MVSCRERKKVGMLFAHLKRILRLVLRQRGPNGAKYEFLLAATAQNLRKLRSSSRSRRPYSPHEAEGLGFASPATTSGAHRHLQSTGYFNDPLIAAVCFAQIAVGCDGLAKDQSDPIRSPAHQAAATPPRVEHDQSPLLP